MIESVLNRFRGTGEIFKISSVSVSGNILYAVYITLVVAILSTWYYGIVAGGLYMLGESMGWGKWVGSLADPESTITLKSRYADDEGTRFPFIHKTANAIVKERENYLRYCQVALAIRGLYWWLPLLMFMAVIGITSYWLAILGSILLGVGFPLACYIGSKLDYNGKFWLINYSKGWENQELVYGLMQGIVLWAVVLLG